MKTTLKSITKELISLFNGMNMINTKLKFKCYDSGMAAYHLEIDKEEEFFEFNICNDNITFYPEMTILELLEKKATYISFRYFTLTSEGTHDCENIANYCLDIDKIAEQN